MEQWLLIAGWLVAGIVSALAAIAITHYRRVVREQEFVIEQLLPRRAAFHARALVVENLCDARPPLGAGRIVPVAERAEALEPNPRWPICQ